MCTICAPLMQKSDSIKKIRLAGDFSFVQTIFKSVLKIFEHNVALPFWPLLDFSVEQSIALIT